MSHSDKYCNGEYQSAVGNMVDHEVLTCASELISNLRSASYELSSEYEQELLDVSIQYVDHSDQIEELEEKIEELESERDNMIEEFEEIQANLDYMTNELWDEWLDQYCHYQIDHTEKIYTDLIDKVEQEKSDLESEQNDPNEAYEHWIVSDWLGTQLKSHGEMVEDIYGLTVWGALCYWSGDLT